MYGRPTIQLFLPATVTFIDWGDAIESVDPKINRPYRLELALYSNQYGPMTAYTMTELAFPSSPQETQGTNTLTYESNYAAVASPTEDLLSKSLINADSLNLEFSNISIWMEQILLYQLHLHKN